MEIDLSTTNLMDWQNAGWSFDPDDVGDISSAEELPEDLPPIDQLDKEEKIVSLKVKYEQLESGSFKVYGSLV